MFDTRRTREILDELVRACEEAGKIVAEISRKSFSVSLKGVGDVVTEADRESEKFLRQKLREIFSAPVLGEEFGKLDAPDNRYLWVVDPLDGTKNFVRGFPYFSVSVGLLERTENGYKPVAGCVNFISFKKIYFAGRGLGAWLKRSDNTLERLHVSEVDNLSDAVISTGFSFKIHRIIDKYLEAFKKFFFTAGAIRKVGCSSLDICLVAEGYYDALWHIGTYPWDVGAGAIIVTEAGGRVSDFWGGEDWVESGFVVVSNSKLHHKILEILRSHFSPEDKSKIER